MKKTVQHEFQDFGYDDMMKPLVQWSNHLNWKSEAQAAEWEIELKAIDHRIKTIRMNPGVKPMPQQRHLYGQ